MLVHGGVDDSGEYLDDTYLLSLTGTIRWYKANILYNSHVPKLAYHSCCLVVPNEFLKNSKFSIYKYPDITLSDNINTQIREQGLYVFGGKRSELKDPSNKLWLLKIGRKPLEWIELLTKGKPPCPRYLCSMNYYEDGNYIIIHGGKTKSLRSENILRDTYLFELYRYEWIKVNYGYFEEYVKPRFSHSGVIYQGKLIIFGGVNEQGFNGSNFFLIKLTPETFSEKLSQKKRATIMKNQLTLIDEKFKINEQDEKKENNVVENNTDKKKEDNVVESKDKNTKKEIKKNYVLSKKK